MTSHGRCYCGAIQFALAEPPLLVGLCHCASCRRSVGATPIAWATYPRAAFELERGAVQWFQSSAHARRGHCAECGTSLFFETTRAPTEIDVTVACLDDANTVAPTHHIWVPAKLAWTHIDDGRPQHVGDSGSARL